MRNPIRTCTWYSVRRLFWTTALECTTSTVSIPRTVLAASLTASRAASLQLSFEVPTSSRIFRTAMASLLYSVESLSGRHDVTRRDLRLVHQFRRLARTRESPHGEVHDPGRIHIRGQRLHHGGADAALWVVVFDDHQAATSEGRGFLQRHPVDRLHTIEVDDARLDTFLFKLVRRGQAVMHGHAGSDQDDPVVRVAADQLGAADGEPGAGVIQHRIGAPGGAEIADPRMVGHCDDERGGRGGVRWIEDRRAVDRPHHRQVLERHLRRTIFTDLDPGVGSGEPDVRLRDRGHANEVVGAAEEGGEGRRERDVVAHAHPDRGGDQLLLGDEDLEVAIRVRLSELLGESRVADLAVHRDDGPTRPQRLERVPVRLAGRHLVALLIGWDRDLDPGVLDRRLAGFRLHPIDAEMAHGAQLAYGALRHVGGQGLAVPVLFVLDLAEALALDRARDHDGGLGGGLARLPQRLVDLLEVVTVDDNRTAATGLDPVAVDIGLPFVFGGSPLSEAIDVEDGGEIRKSVEAGLVEPFPDRSLGQLAIARQRPDMVGELVELATGERHAHGDRQPLAERAGGHVD